MPAPMQLELWLMKDNREGGKERVRRLKEKGRPNVGLGWGVGGEATCEALNLWVRERIC